MEDKEGTEKRSRKVPTERIGIVALILLMILIGVSISGYLWNWGWTGLRGTTDDGPKTLWHWLDLLIIPLVLTAGAWWFKKIDEDTRRTREKREKEIERERREAEAKTSAFVEEQRAQESALETYFDRMSELLLDKESPLLESKPSSPCQDMAFTRTLTALRRLDKKRRNQVFDFLRDARLLGAARLRVVDHKEEGTQSMPKYDADPIAVFAGRNMRCMDLRGADLYGANLSGAYLYSVNLSGAYLKGVNLEGTDLTEAKLIEANLEMARLHGANLFRTNLEKANLEAADLEEANLEGANLLRTNLKSAGLRWANLYSISNLTCDQLKTARNWEQADRDKELACGADIPDSLFTDYAH